MLYYRTNAMRVELLLVKVFPGPNVSDDLSVGTLDVMIGIFEDS